MAKKTAMVQPKPRVSVGKPVGADGIRPVNDALELIKLLELMGNNRAYTVVRSPRASDGRGGWYPPGNVGT